MSQSKPRFPQARVNDLVTQELSDEVLIYDLKNHKAHCLNLIAATVWQHCDGETSIPEIASRSSQSLNQKLGTTTVWQAIEELSKASLLEEPMRRPPEIPRLGRREAIRKLGGGSAIAVPIVMSIVAPTALAGCTFPNDQPFYSLCCTHAQCSAGLICCSNFLSSETRCRYGSGHTCGSGFDCCSGNCLYNSFLGRYICL
ncbi:MAG: PqqD family protein [Acidobacteria bacterium]|nr:PqqD family protein [Acidobacteriota bacterium]